MVPGVSKLIKYIIKAFVFCNLSPDLIVSKAKQLLKLHYYQSKLKVRILVKLR